MGSGAETDTALTPYPPEQHVRVRGGAIVGGLAGLLQGAPSALFRHQVGKGCVKKLETITCRCRQRSWSRTPTTNPPWSAFCRADARRRSRRGPRSTAVCRPASGCSRSVCTCARRCESRTAAAPPPCTGCTRCSRTSAPSVPNKTTREPRAVRTVSKISTRAIPMAALLTRSAKLIERCSDGLEDRGAEEAFMGG